MNRWSALVMFAVVTCVFTGCLPKATEQECSDMCQNLATLKAGKDTKPLDKQIASIEESYAKRIADIGTKKDATIADLDKQLNEKLAAAKTEDEKKKITDEYTPLKETAANDAVAAISALEAKKAEEIASANEKAKAREAASAKIVEECVTQCKTEGTLQKVAQCRIQAQDIDSFYNKCR